MTGHDKQTEVARRTLMDACVTELGAKPSFLGQILAATTYFNLLTPEEVEAVILSHSCGKASVPLKPPSP